MAQALSHLAAFDNNETSTIGGRVQFDPISQITLGAELAYQLGDYSQIVANQRNRSAMAADIFGTYRFDNAWKKLAGHYRKNIIAHANVVPFPDKNLNWFCKYGSYTLFELSRIVCVRLTR